MRTIRYSINVTLDGRCDHRAMVADEDLHRHAVENLNQPDAHLFGRATYEMMETAFRPPARTGGRPDWMEPFARTIADARLAGASVLARPHAGLNHLLLDLIEIVQGCLLGVDRLLDQMAETAKRPSSA